MQQRIRSSISNLPPEASELEFVQNAYRHLIEAIDARDHMSVAFILKANLASSAKDDGYAFRYAYMNSSLDVVRRFVLFDEGTRRHLLRAMMDCIVGEREDVFRLLLDAVKSKDRDLRYMTVFLTACLYNNAGIIKLMLDSNVKPPASVVKMTLADIDMSDEAKQLLRGYLWHDTAQNIRRKYVRSAPA